MHRIGIIVIILASLFVLVGCADEPVATTTVAPTTATTEVIVVTPTVRQEPPTTTTVVQSTTTTEPVVTTTSVTNKQEISREEKALAFFAREGSWEQSYPIFGKTVSIRFRVDEVYVREEIPEHLEIGYHVNGIDFRLEVFPDGTFLLEPNEEPAWSEAVYNDGEVARAVLNALNQRISIR